MDRKTYSIGILTLTAVVLGVGLLFAPSSTAVAAPAGVVSRDRDYSLSTAATQGGGDALYILDARRGRLAVLTYDNSSRGFRLRANQAVSDAFRSANPK